MRSCFVKISSGSTFCKVKRKKYKHIDWIDDVSRINFKLLYWSSACLISKQTTNNRENSCHFENDALLFPKIIKISIYSVLWPSEYLHPAIKIAMGKYLRLHLVPYSTCRFTTSDCLFARRYVKSLIPYGENNPCCRCTMYINACIIHI